MGWSDEMNTLYGRKIPFLFVLDFDLNNPLVLPLDKIEPEKILFKINHLGNSESQTISGVTSIRSFPESFTDFEKKFQRVKDEISKGNSYLLNLCLKTPVKLSHSLKEIFHLSRARYKLWLKDSFTLFSPESFVQIRAGGISCYPMKGTLEKRDENSIRQLQNNPKEAAEHATITDLLRNDLGKVSDHVKVKKYRYIEEIPAGSKILLQASSAIEGRISDPFKDRPGDIFRELLPAGSITGAPKKRTVEIIKETENFDREWFTGVFGIFDGRQIDSAVMIRFIEQNGNSFFYKSGAGITFMSDAEQEYQEIMQKIYVPIH